MTARRMYLVRRLVLHVDGAGDGGEPVLDDSVSHGNGVRHRFPVAAYPTREAAVADARARNEQLRELLNPLWLNNVTNGDADASPLPDLAAFGIQIPPADVVHSQYGDYETTANQVTWYDGHAADWPAAVRDAVWRHLAPNTDLFDVIEIELDDGA